jgi:hypothetical protein
LTTALCTICKTRASHSPPAHWDPPRSNPEVSSIQVSDHVCCRQQTAICCCLCAMCGEPS